MRRRRAESTPGLRSSRGSVRRGFAYQTAAAFC